MSDIVEDAFESFRQISRAAGLLVDAESHADAFGSRFIRVTGDRAELRLLWDGKEQHLSLEISHGPASGESVGYIELFGATFRVGLGLESQGSIEGVRKAMEYGVELMSGERKST